MKCPYGMQRWNHFLKQQQNKTKQNQYTLHLVQSVKKKKRQLRVRFYFN